MGKSANDGTGFNFYGSGTGFGLGNDFGKILGTTLRTVGNMGCSRPTGHAGGVNAILIGLFNRGNTVGGHQNRAVKGGELLVLQPPGVTVIADEMIIFLESRIIIGRQHFAVGININTSACGLLEEFFHVFEIMAGDQNTGVVAHTNVDTGDFRIAVGCRMGLIEQGHGRHGDLTTFQHLANHFIDTQVARGRSKGRNHEIVDFRLLKTEHRSVIGVSCHPLKTVNQQFTQRAHIFVGL